MEDPLCHTPVCTPVCTLFVPLIFQMLIFQPKIKIMPQNFQDIIFGLYKVHQKRHGRPIVPYPCSYPCLYPVCTPEFSNAYISADNEDNTSKLPGYDPWDLQTTSIMSRMTLSSKSPIRQPQCPPSTPFLDPPFLIHF